MIDRYGRLLKHGFKLLVCGLLFTTTHMLNAQTVTLDSLTRSVQTSGNCYGPGTTVNYTAHGSITNSSDSVTITVDYDDGNPVQNEGFVFDSLGSYQKNFNHTFNSSDTFRIEVMADITGSSDTARDTVIINGNCATLSGTLYNDVDSNCQLSNPDLKVDNRKVMLANNMGTPIASTMADGSGSYSFSIDTMGNPTYQVKLNDTGQLRHGCQSATQTVNNPASANVNFGLNAPNGSFSQGVVLASSISGNCIKPNQFDTFNLKVQTNTPAPVTYQVDFGDSGGYGAERTAFPDTFGNYNIEFSHKYDSVGTFDLRVYATNGNQMAELESLQVRVANDCQTITGRVFVDTNQNCSYDAGETALQKRNVILRTPSDSLIGFMPTDQNGQYTFSVDSTKNYKVVLKDTGNLTYGCTSNGVQSVNNPPATMVDFGLNCTGTDYGVGNTTVQNGSFRIGQARDLSFNVSGLAACNQDSLSCVKVVLDSGQFTADSLYPAKPNYPKFSSLNGDTVTYNLQQTSASDFKNVKLPIFTKNTVSMSDTLCVMISLCTNNDIDQTNDQLTICRNAVNSFDPNNKVVTPKGTDSLGYIQDSTKLTYTVNFQNTGNDTAFNATIKDTLDKDLDATTLNVIGSSDNFNLSINQGRFLTFDFPNIDLPDSTTNLSESKGFITFTVSPKQGAGPDTQFTNYADIIFDQNPAIRTDTTINTICKPIGDTLNVSGCFEFFYAPDDTTLFTSGPYYDTMKAANGCDSVILLNVTINKPTFNSNVTDSGCGSYTVPSGDTTFTTNQSNFPDTLVNSVGCDSIIILNITITDTARDTIAPVTCGTYQVPSGDTTYASSGTFTDTLTTSTGCDSIFTINLTILPDERDTLDVTTCNEYTVPSGDETLKTSGQFFDTIPGTGGCDTVLTINLTIDNFVRDTITPRVCDSFTVPSGDTTLFTSGTYPDTFVRPGTCDSIVQVDLTVIPPKQSTINVSTCGSFTVPSGDETLQTSGTFLDTIPSVGGCDSIITINLTIKQEVTSTISRETCNSFTVPSGDETLQTSGTFLDTIPSVGGCDSVITINLTIKGEITNTVSQVACNSFTVPSGDETYTTSGTVNDTIPSVEGCDSVITFNLTIQEEITSTVSEVACNAFTVPSGDETYTTSGTYLDTIPSVGGCDSVITFNLTIGQDKQVTTSIKSCNSFTVPSGDETYTTDGTYMDTIPTQRGCDSILTINLTLGALDTTISRAPVKKLIANAPNASYQWLICDSTGGFKPIDGSNSKTFSAFRNTSYAVAIQQGNCSDTSNCFRIQNVGVGDNKRDEGVKVYPNPAQDKLNVEINKQVEQLNLVNLTGQRVLQRQSIGQGVTTLDIQGLSQGVYMLKLFTDEGIETQKVVIK